MYVLPDTDFAVDILESEVVVAHLGEGHVDHFPILTNNTVCTDPGSNRTPPQSGKRGASCSMRTTARVALGRSLAEGNAG